ncbi:MAG: hypothetical protein OEX07_12190, partial [Gammaproteobacteria bacterium]|nr:hypothetical protein [Gammaproteobacteria bacterium]
MKTRKFTVIWLFVAVVTMISGCESEDVVIGLTEADSDTDTMTISSTTHDELNTDTVIEAGYDNGTNMTVISLETNHQADLPRYTFTITLTGAPVVGSYDTEGNNVSFRLVDMDNAISRTENTITNSTVTISEAGEVGSRIVSTFNASLCDINNTSDCVIYEGDFSVTREADTGTATDTNIVPALPDFSLAITQVQNEALDDVTLLYTLTNNGGDFVYDSTKEPIITMFYHHSDTAPDFNSEPNATALQLQRNLPAGESIYYFSRILDSTWVTNQSYKAYAIFDFYNALEESDETNNISARFDWKGSEFFYYYFTRHWDANTSDITNIVASYNSGNDKASISLSAYYDSTFGDYGTSINLVTNGLPTITTYSTNASTLDFTNIDRSTTWIKSPNHDSTVTLNSVGAVGELITGNYNVYVCTIDDISDNSVCDSPLNRTGNFTVIRE